jgi:ferritin
MNLYKLPQSVINLLQKRVLDEKTAEYFYQAAALWCRNKGYDEGYEYFTNESKDEKKHFKKLTGYLADWGANGTLPSINSRDISFNDLNDILEQAYQMEYDLMLAYQDISATIFTSHMVTFDFLVFYRNIQNESVIQYGTLLNKLASYSKEDEVFFVKNELK